MDESETDINLLNTSYTRPSNSSRIIYEKYNVIAAKIITLFPKETTGKYFSKPIRKNNFVNGRCTRKIRRDNATAKINHQQLDKNDSGIANANAADTVLATEPPPTQSKPSINSDPESWDYDMSGVKSMVIFNNVKTGDLNNKLPNSSKVTNEDVTSLKETFGKLGFKVVTHNDATHGEIFEIMKEIQKEDHSKTSCFILVILTHGDKEGNVIAKDKQYLLKDLTCMLETAHTGLVKKPKLFFIQACRGDNMDEDKSAPTETEIDGPVVKEQVVPSHMDFLFMHSSVDVTLAVAILIWRVSPTTISKASVDSYSRVLRYLQTIALQPDLENSVSWRDDCGSWLKELCNVVDTRQEDQDLLQLITLTQKNVVDKRSCNTMPKWTHMPEARFTLTKFVKF